MKQVRQLKDLGRKIHGRMWGLSQLISVRFLAGKRKLHSSGGELHKSLFQEIQQWVIQYSRDGTRHQTEAVAFSNGSQPTMNGQRGSWANKNPGLYFPAHLALTGTSHWPKPTWSQRARESVKAIQKHQPAGTAQAGKRPESRPAMASRKDPNHNSNSSLTRMPPSAQATAGASQFWPVSQSLVFSSGCYISASMRRKARAPTPRTKSEFNIPCEAPEKDLYHIWAWPDMEDTVL